MHCHTSDHSSCSVIDAVSMVKEVMKRGLQGMVLTEHHYLWTPGEIKRLREKAEVDESFLIFPAQEVGTDIGHVLVFGADRTIGEETSLVRLRQDFPHAALIWAHPLRKGKIPAENIITSPILDAIEIFNTNHTPLENYYGLKLWHKYKFNAVSGSDAHSGDSAGMLPTLFDHPLQSIDDLVAEIRKGRCRPFYKEIPRAGGNRIVTEIILGAKGETERRSRIVLKSARKLNHWRQIRRASQVSRSIYDHGFSEGSFRVPKIMELNDEEKLAIEEGQRGKSLFDLMKQVSPSTGDLYFELAARWLARLHRQSIRIGGMSRTKKQETKRFGSYMKAFRSTNSPFLGKVSKLMDAVKKFEEGLFTGGKDRFVQIHGDYHPKNIIIGQDRMQDMDTIFISVIDFESTLVFEPAFDVGYFISQFAYQFRLFPHITKRYGPEDFMKSYLEACGGMEGGDFPGRVDLFRIRANLSIGAYLVKVGKGESPDMEWIILESMALLEGNKK